MTQSPEIAGRHWMMVLLLGLIWGSTFMVIELALEGITPFWLAAGRISFAAVLTAGIWGLTTRKLWLSEQRAWGSMIVIGLFSTAIPFQLLSWGQKYVTSGFAGVSMATVALMVLPLSHFFVPGERMTTRRAIGFVIGFIGVVILIGPDAFSSAQSDMEIWGRLACVAAASCYAISSVMMRRLPPVDPIGLSAIPLIIGAVFVLVTAYGVEGAPPAVSGRTLVILAILGLIPTAGANLLRVLVIRSAGPVFMSLTNYQVPMWSVIFGIVILGDPTRPDLFVAMGFILVGVGLSQYGALRRLFGRG